MAGTSVARTSAAESSNYPVLFASAESGGFAEVVEANFGSDGLDVRDLTRYKVPSGGVATWVDDDDDSAAELVGVIAYWGVARSYWEKGLDEVEETGPPQCASADGQFGYGEFGPGSAANPTGACATCPMNEWRSGKGESKACKEQRRVWLLRPGATLPVQISLPPTSIQPFRKFMTKISGDGKAYFEVEAKLTLESVKMGPNKVGRAVVKRVRDLEPEEAAAAKAYHQQIQGLLRATARNEVEGEVTSSGPAGGGDGMDPFADEPVPPADLAD